MAERRLNGLPSITSVTGPRTPSAQSRVTPRVAPRLAAPRPRGGGGTVEFKRVSGETDDGFSIGDIGRSIGSAAGYVGGVIKGLPVLAGKVGQTALGLGEFAVDTVLDVPTLFGAPEFFKSRYEQDWEKAKDLGLSGWDQWKYASQRQYPIFAPMAEGIQRTGGNIVEMSTYGLVDVGEPGINYFNALKQGNLGAVLLEDIGNVVLVGRAGGAGSLTAKAGGALAAAGKPRIGATVTAVGRLADEPLSATARGVAGLAGRGATQVGLGKTGAALGRVATAVQGEAPTISAAFRAGARGTELPAAGPGVGPLRQAYQEVVGARTVAALEEFDNLQRQINEKNDQRDLMPVDDPRRLQIDEQITELKYKQKGEIDKTRLPKDARKNIFEMQERGEQIRTTLQTELARISRDGYVLEAPQAIRERATRLREQARAIEDPEESQRLTDLADMADRQASVKEANPGVLDTKPPSWVSPATVILLTRRANIVIEELNNGRSFQDVADLLTPIEVGPDLELKGYRFTAADVEAVYRYATGQLDEAQRLMIDMTSVLYQSWYKLFNTARLKGVGGSEPLPFTYLQDTPDPKFLVEQLSKSRDASAILKLLDTATISFLATSFPELLKDLGVSTRKFAGIFKKLSARDYNDPLFALANGMVGLLYDDLLQFFPGVFRNEMIYPAPMRPSIIAQNRALQDVRGTSLVKLLDDMGAVIELAGDLLGKRTVDSLRRKQKELPSSAARYSRAQWSALRRQIVEARQRLQDPALRAQIERKIGEAETELTAKAGRLIDAEQRLEAMEATLRTIEADPQAFLGDIGVKELSPVQASNLAQLQERAASIGRHLAGFETLRGMADDFLLNKRIAEFQGYFDAISKRIDDYYASVTRSAELTPQQRAAEVRARLKGVAKVEQANLPDGGKSPALTISLLKTQADRAQRAIVTAQKREAKAQEQLRNLREKHAALDEAPEMITDALLAAETPIERQMAQPFGPQAEAPGESTIYLPGGTTALARGGRNLPTELRAEGMPGQTLASYERLRETDLMPLSMTEVGQRMSEVLSAMNRNETVQQIVMDPKFASNAASLLGAEKLADIEREATRRVTEQSRVGKGDLGLVRDPEAIKQAIRKEYGRMLYREIDRLGYEPVSPVKVNPDGTSEPLGDLLSQVNPEDVDPLTYLMRKGMVQQITQQFVVKDTGNIPPGIKRTFDRVGRLTSGWKSMILPFSLRWQVGDAVSNVMMAWVRGDIKPSELAKSFQDVYSRLRAQETKFLESVESSIADPVLSTLIGAGLQARGLRLGDIAALRAGVPTAGIDTFGLRGPFQGFREKMFRLNELHNTVARLSVAMKKLGDVLDEQGRSIDEVNPAAYLSDPAIRDAINQAVKETNNALGAFSQLSPWEKNVVRQAWPFWSWLKFINKAAAQMVLDDPDRVLFMANLGALALEDEDSGFFDFLQGTVPIQGMLFDLSFLNPYQDAVLFKPNVIKALQDQIGSLSPVIVTPAKAAQIVAYYATGDQQIPLGNMTRPGYLEGRPGATSRTFGDMLGELGYLGLTSFGGPARNVLRAIPFEEIPIIAPEGRLLGTDVAIGNRQVYPQGSARTTGAYAEPRLGPVAAPVRALLSTFGVPAPIAEISRIAPQASLQRQREAAARSRRERERERSRLG